MLKFWENDDLDVPYNFLKISSFLLDTNFESIAQLHDANKDSRKY